MIDWMMLIAWVRAAEQVGSLTALVQADEAYGRRGVRAIERGAKRLDAAIVRALRGGR